MARRSRTLWIVLLLGGAGVALYIAFGAGDKVGHRATTDTAPADGAGNVAGNGGRGEMPRPATAPGATQSAPADKVAAKELFDRGMALLAEKNDDRLIKARQDLSDAYFSGSLAPELEDQARRRLEELADRTIFAAAWMDGDPYSDRYVVKPRDSLQKIEQAQRLHVPAELLAKVNNVDPGKLQEGRAIKLIRGPFNAVVYKSRFAMDVYLQRDDYPRVFVRRFQVGLGRNGSTPLGFWHVRLGRTARPKTDTEPAQGSISGKLRQARFDPPPGSEATQSIAYGESGYPFGKMGLFIPLEGDDENTGRMVNYGIHSTNDPDSIGKEGSLGCIRLKDDDIEMVYMLLYEKWSKVETRP